MPLGLCVRFLLGTICDNVLCWLGLRNEESWACRILLAATGLVESWVAIVTAKSACGMPDSSNRASQIQG